VQVKSTELMVQGCQVCQLRGFDSRWYTAKELDHFAGYVVPADVCYLFPVTRLLGMDAVGLTPHRKRQEYERYLEAWWFLTRHHLLPGKTDDCSG